MVHESVIYGIHTTYMFNSLLSASEKLHGNYNTKDHKLCLEDGSIITEDDDLLCEDIVKGKLLTIAAAQPAKKNVSVILEGSQENLGNEMHLYIKPFLHAAFYFLDLERQIHFIALSFAILVSLSTESYYQD